MESVALERPWRFAHLLRGAVGVVGPLIAIAYHDQPEEGWEDGYTGIRR